MPAESLTPREWAATARSSAGDVALALLVTCVELVLLLDGGSANAFAILLTVATGGALALRRLAPLAVLATTLVAATGVVALDEAPGGMGVLVALYTVARMLERRVSLAALTPTVLVVTFLDVAIEHPNDVNSVLVGMVTVIPLTVGVWGLGAYVQTQQHYRRGLDERAAQLEREREHLARIAVHEERATIARELHDVVAHSVGVMLVGVRGARDVLRMSPDASEEILARVETNGEQSLSELGRILALLREPEERVESRPQPSLAELDELVANFREAGLPVELEIVGKPRLLASGIELSIYRIVQEALTNVLKHARPTRIAVRLAFLGARVRLEVENDGVAAEGGAPAGYGLVGIRERVALLKGELELGATLDGGFRLLVRLPEGEEA